MFAGGESEREQEQMNDTYAYEITVDGTAEFDYYLAEEYRSKGVMTDVVLRMQWR